MELIADAIDGDSSADRPLHPVVNEIALGSDGGVEVVVAKLHGVSTNVEGIQRIARVDKGVVHILRISGIVVRIGRDRVPLAAAESVELAFVNGLVYHIPYVNVALIVINQRVDMVLQP